MEIKIRDLNKYFRKKLILKNINCNFSLDNNKIYGIVGPNGSGKTTLLKTISGILKAESGNIDIGENYKYTKWVYSNIIYIFSGERGLKLKNTVRDNIIYYGILKGTDKQIILKNISEFSHIINFEDILEKRVDELSTGQRKKAAILCGLCSGMKIIIFDEPSNGLDIDAVIELTNILKVISEQFNITLIVSSHDIDFLSTIATDYIFLLKGQIKFHTDSVLSKEEITKKYIEMKNEVGEID